MKFYIWNLLISIDQFFNTFFLGGDPDETISSNMGKRARNGEKVGIYVCKVLDKFQRDHCEKSIELDEGRKLEQ